MLVLTRKPGERIVLGDPESPLGVIMVRSIEGNRVRLGLELPRDVSILREELVPETSPHPRPPIHGVKR